MPLQCAILDDYPGKALQSADWSALGDRVEVRAYHEHFKRQEDLVAAVKDCQILVAMRERTRFDAALFAQLPQLKLLVTSGMRNAAIDVKAAERHGVVVSGTKSLKEPPMELTWGLILAVSRHIAEDNARFHAGGPWQSPVGLDLHGRTIGLLGLGHIGQRMAVVAKAFGMKVVAWSQNLTTERAAECGVHLASSKADLLKQSDVVSVHLKLSERTRDLIDAEALAQMKASAILVNTSRAAIVNQVALVEALKGGGIAGAATDVLEAEPPTADCPLRGVPNLLVTSHVGYVTEANYRHYFTGAVEDIQAFLDKAPIRELYASNVFAEATPLSRL